MSKTKLTNRKLDNSMDFSQVRFDDWNAAYIQRYTFASTFFLFMYIYYFFSPFVSFRLVSYRIVWFATQTTYTDANTNALRNLNNKCRYAANNMEISVNPACSLNHRFTHCSRQRCVCRHSHFISVPFCVYALPWSYNHIQWNLSDGRLHSVVSCYCCTACFMFWGVFCCVGNSVKWTRAQIQCVHFGTRSVIELLENECRC